MAGNTVMENPHSAHDRGTFIMHKMMHWAPEPCEQNLCPHDL